jgi:hypothetical protein
MFPQAMLPRDINADRRRAIKALRETALSEVRRHAVVTKRAVSEEELREFYAIANSTMAQTQ